MRMKYFSIIISLCIAFVVSNANAQEENHFRKMSLEALEKLKTVKKIPFSRTTHPDAQWFPEAGFGLFMHWGIHSVAGIDASWPMMKNTTFIFDPDKENYYGKNYYKLLTKFNPQNYDPDKWIKAAAEAGMTYAVLTTKHCDGYALWPSEYGEMSTKQYMNGRDLLMPYVEACRKYGIKVGFYYTAMDWGYPGYPVILDCSKTYVLPPEIDAKQNRENYEKYYEYTVGQLSELLTRYGKIDLMWFDGNSWIDIDNYHNEETLAWIRMIQPHIVINNRWGGKTGDYVTPEWAMPEKAPNGWWENCTSWSGHWGYSPDTLIEPNISVMDKLVTARAWDGNLLLNIGPAPDGTMRPEYYKRTKELAKWMTHNKESLIGTRGIKNWKDFSDVPITRRDNKWYLHILPSFWGGVVRLKDIPEPREIKMLRTNKTLRYLYEKKQLSIILSPDTVQKKLNDVIVLYWDEEPVK